MSEPEEVEIVDRLPAVPAPAEATLPALFPQREEMRGMAELAMTLCQARALPEALRDKPADVFLIMLTARDLGVAPTTALRTFHVINGNVTLAPKVRKAMVHQQGLGRIWPHQPPRQRIVRGKAVVEYCDCGQEDDANNEDVATWHAQRADDPATIYTSTFTAAMAGGIKYDSWEKDGNTRKRVERTLADKDNWQHYPARMVSWRALGYLLDDAFPEVGTGLYSADEMGAVTDDDGLPVIDLKQTDPLVGPKRGRPAPVDPEPNPAEFAELQERIDVIRRCQPAAAALREKWQEQDEDGNVKIPPLSKLRHSHMIHAKAIVAWVEKRGRDGEFGAWPPPDAVETPADESGSPDTALDGPETAGADDSAPEPPVDPARPILRSWDEIQEIAGHAPEDIQTEAIERVKAMDKTTVQADLLSRQLPHRGPDDQIRYRLALAVCADLVARRNEGDTDSGGGELADGMLPGLVSDVT